MSTRRIGRPRIFDERTLDISATELVERLAAGVDRGILNEMEARNLAGWWISGRPELSSKAMAKYRRILAEVCTEGATPTPTSHKVARGVAAIASIGLALSAVNASRTPEPARAVASTPISPAAASPTPTADNPRYVKLCEAI